MKRFCVCLLCLLGCWLSVTSVRADEAFALDIVCVDKDDVLLASCAFNLYKDDELLSFAEDEDSDTYVVAKSGVTTIRSPLAHLRGLSAGEYVLKEVSKPANMASHEDVIIELNNDKLAVISNNVNGDLLYVSGGVCLQYQNALSLAALNSGFAPVLIAVALTVVFVGIMLRSVKRIFKESENE